MHKTDIFVFCNFYTFAKNVFISKTTFIIERFSVGFLIAKKFIYDVNLNYSARTRKCLLHKKTSPCF